MLGLAGAIAGLAARSQEFRKVDHDIDRFAQRYSQVAILFHFAVLQCRSSCNFGGSVMSGGAAAAGM